MKNENSNTKAAAKRVEGSDTSERRFQVPPTPHADERRIKALREWEERSEQRLMGYRARL